MGKDFLRDLLVADKGNQSPAAPAAIAVQHVDAEGAAE